MLKKKRLLLFLGTLFLFFNYIGAQEEEKQPKIKIEFEARADMVVNKISDDTSSHTLSGFRGRIFNFLAQGDINERFSYKVRHRLNRSLDGSLNEGFLNATDFLWLSWKLNDDFYLVGGKQVIAIGGLEYDYVPIDVYFLSNFTNHVNPFAVGLTLQYRKKEDLIGLQVVNSPFSDKTLGGLGLNNLYGYSLIWYGTHSNWRTIYSFNFFEYQRGRFVNYLALSNRFNLSSFALEVDIQNRTTPERMRILKDFTCVGNLIYQLHPQLDFFVKVGYDQNKDDINPLEVNLNRYVVAWGTEYTFGGFGMEYYPIKNKKDVRLHAFWAASRNRNQGTTINDQLFNAGLSWRIKAL